ncbi:MAG: tRNA (adenosine(37)-N6)-threonylcarbamoyltransferase complex ATPase subunit type 1 TsaE, partial [Clostridia bacterium]|nr:tRNA (adenosine(37)-N6)-threonylcarbamoyltransferase complex ATPase subunit type 1 TsaE [Clostridia bacterium]
VFVRGLTRGLQAEDDVSSPTFALVHEYGGRPPLVHFDMYRITSWDDLYSTGFFDYIDQGCVLAVEWSANIENALPDGTVFVQIRKTEQEGERILEIEGEGIHETLES